MTIFIAIASETHSDGKEKIRIFPDTKLAEQHYCCNLFYLDELDNIILTKDVIGFPMSAEMIGYIIGCFTDIGEEDKEIRVN